MEGLERNTPAYGRTGEDRIMKKRIVIAVISDLVTDQRVHKVSLSLHDAGYEVLLLGAKRNKSAALSPRPYKAKRIRMLFQKGPLFYAEWNIRLLFKLLFLRADAITANDLDTLPAVFIAARIKQCPVIYDTHEYFTEMEELQGRHTVKRIWQWLEKVLFKRVKFISTVNQSIAGIYKEKYGKELVVIRNLPMRSVFLKHQDNTGINRFSPATSRILLSQGAGLHPNRGLEELALAMKLLPLEYRLVFAGGGLAIEQLKQLVREEQLEERVQFTGLVPMETLSGITRTAFIGFSLDKSTSLNNHFSLPNKLFDYMAAGVPVIASNMPEVKRVVEEYKTGLIIREVTPEAIAGAVLQLASSEEQYLHYCTQARKAMEQLCWENETVALLEMYREAMK